MASSSDDPYLPLIGVLHPTEHIKVAINVRPQSQSSEGAQCPAGILSIVSHVTGPFEEGCVILLKRRKQDSATVGVLDAVPLLEGTQLLVQKSAEDGSLGSSTLTVAAGGKSLSVVVDDAQGLEDIMTVARTLIAVAAEHKAELGQTHSWVDAYSDTTLSDPGAPVYSRFSRSNFTQPVRPRAPSPSPQELKISIASFNVNGQLPVVAAEDARPGVLQVHSARSLAGWLHAEDDPDILVVGLQEMDLSSAAYLYHSPWREEQWVSSIEAAMGRRKGEYTRLSSKCMVGILQFVYVRTVHLHRITGFSSGSVGVGLGGLLGNKGAVGVRFRVDGKSFCFLNAHLSAFDGPEAAERRRWDFAEIGSRLKFAMTLEEESAGLAREAMKDEKPGEVKQAVSTAHVSSAANDPTSSSAITLREEEPPTPTISDRSVDSQPSYTPIQLDVSDHDLIFFSGDLNMRLHGVDIVDVKKLVRKRQFEALLNRDELIKDRAEDGGAFGGWQEGKIDFPPTYKYDLDTSEFDTSPKHRCPAWTDRVIWRARAPADVRQVVYESYMGLTLSDHKPILAVFIVKTR